MLKTIDNDTEGCLRKVSQPIVFDDTSAEFLERLVKVMMKTVIDSGGIGLAAPQVGISKRVIIIKRRAHSDFLVMINPSIIRRVGKLVACEEGCLSVPGKAVLKKRHASVLVAYQTVDGKHLTKTFDNVDARCVQHEIDHLDGVLISDE
jgi:peptide deformylase